MMQQPADVPGNGVSGQLQDLLLQCTEVEEFLGKLATFSATRLSVHHEVICGVTLVRRRKPTTLASSDPRVLILDEMQYGFGDGPCFTAIRELTTVHVPSLRDEPRWPHYCNEAWKDGIGSILAVALPLEG